MKYLYSLIFLSCCLFFSSCDDERLLGEGRKIEWNKTTYNTTEIDGANYFTVPQEGGTYVFESKTHPHYDVENVFILFTEEPSRRVWLEMKNYTKVDGNKLTVDFPANDSTTRYVLVHVSFANDNGGLLFIQEGVKQEKD